LSGDQLFIRELRWQEPVELFARLCHLPGIAFLDSASTGDPRATASYIAVDPVEEIVLDLHEGENAMAVLRQLHRPRDELGPLPFTGGLIGLLSYDLGARALGLASRHDPDPELPAMVVRRYDLVIGFDHGARRAWGFARDRSSKPAAARLDEILDRPAPSALSTRALDWREESSRDDHRVMIESILSYVAAGDIYQANVSTRFLANRPVGFSAPAAYLALRERSPAPFAAYLDLGRGSTLLSASPERFIRCDPAGAIETRPIKGTAPRAADPAEDRRNGEALARSAKNRAENLMICDLLRNDLSKVASEGSVVVSQLAELERFASVWHLVSAVHGHLGPGKDVIDLISATLPGGSITGAPKKRAVEIIDQVEHSARGPFFGIVFALAVNGTLDSMIVIRSIVATPTRLLARAGGGIVADSDPGEEYAELRAKVDPILGVPPSGTTALAQRSRNKGGTRPDGEVRG